MAGIYDLTHVKIQNPIIIAIISQTSDLSINAESISYDELMPFDCIT